MKNNFKECIEKCKNIHNNKYDYSKTIEPKTTHDKITIICPIHGEFRQSLKNHLSGYGCKNCAIEQNINKQLLNRDNVIDKCLKSKFGRNILYDKFVYKGMHKVSVFTCPIHGEFKMEPSNIIKGHGCPKCGKERIKKNKKYTNDIFIKKAIKIYGENRYDYSKINYIDCYTPITIFCNKCKKWFEQIPYLHLQHHGCQKCNETIIEEEIEKYLIDRKIDFKYQKHFKWLGKQSIDFFILSAVKPTSL